MNWNIIVIIILIIYFLVCIYLEIHSKYAIIISLILVGVSAIILTFGDFELANKVAITVFYFLIIAVGLAIIEGIKYLRLKNKKVSKKLLRKKTD